MYTVIIIIEYTMFNNFSISIALTWKMIKPHIAAIIQDIIFPLMCHSEADQELWETDPHEYISQKFGKNRFFYIILLFINHFYLHLI